MTTLKLFILAIIFVATSGALFSEFFKEHKFLTFLASVMAIIGSFYLIREVYHDIKDDVIAELKIKSTQNEPIPVERETFPAGKVFRDSLQVGGYAPEMVVIPAGNFQMGDIQDGGDSDEKPVHWVSIEKFAMGKYEVTVGDFRKFVNASGYKTEAEKNDGCYVYDGDNWSEKKDANWRNPYFSQTNSQPVVCVSWNDAIAYTEWLTQQTGEHYRLPSESEWEYAARAGTDTKYWWGNDIGENRAACNGCGSHWDNKQTAPVGSFSANPFGLHDTVGNVWEWIADSWHKDYTNAPNDGRIWAEGADKNYRVLRGGSWDYYSNITRAAVRGRYNPDFRYVSIGFRVVRRVVARIN
jgi:formylglycine-generating enzyme required for sulfatase activity